MEQSNSLEKLCLDLGSSSDKGFNLVTGTRFIYENNILAVDEDEDLTDYYTASGQTDNIDITVEKQYGDKISLIPLTGAEAPASYEAFAKRYIKGHLAEQYSPLTIVPVSVKPKCYQQTTYVNLLADIALQMVENNRTYADILVGVLLPPREYLDKDLKGLFVKNIAGTYKITFNQSKRIVKFNISKEDIIIASECSAALATFIFDINGNIRPEAIRYGDGDVIAIDGGRSTTDIALIRKHQPVVGSYYTVAFGGDLVTDLLAKYIRDDLKMERPKDEMLEKAVKTGFIKDGSKFIDVSAQVVKAKKRYNQSLYTEFLSYMKTQRYPFKSIEAILFVGGLFLNQETLGTPTMTAEPIKSTGEYFMKKYAELSPNTDKLFIDDARFANLEGIVRKVKALTEVAPENN